jgi:hypothetical protein
MASIKILTKTAIKLKEIQIRKEVNSEQVRG